MIIWKCFIGNFFLFLKITFSVKNKKKNTVKKNKKSKAGVKQANFYWKK